MIKIVAHNYVKAEDVDKAVPIFKELAQKSRAEDGCISYDLFVDKRDAGHIVIIEGWETKEALKAHGESAHFAALTGQIRPFAAKEGYMTVMNALDVG
ncbi:antibiotic biosynthesis monooxygenase [Ruminococcaceae bacterium OttesenSCG-928-O06]|nr:antibiotic biosynthesis monooxygenase [Ruminococcaceae bacterium OttesenSCG-928-O06]